MQFSQIIFRVDYWIKSEPMRVGTVGIVCVFVLRDFDSTITATPLSKFMLNTPEENIYILELWISSWLSTGHFTILKMSR